MKKRLFSFLFFAWVWAFVSPIMLSAKVMDTRNIELRTESDTDNELRSLLPVRAWIDGNTVYVSFLGSPAHTDISITSVKGGMCQIEAYSFPKVVTIPVTGTGMFKIEISYDNNLFVGNFKLD